MSQYPHLFSPIRVGTIELPNRIVFAGHGSRFVDWHHHHLVDRQAHYLAERAKGGAGLIIQGSSMVHPTGLGAAGVNEVWSDDSIPSYSAVATAVHDAGGRIFGQLSHLGRQGHTFSAHRELWAPSAVPDPARRVVPHAMDPHDIAELIDAYGDGAHRLQQSGFDGIEVYLAHGYLLCEFLSRFSNTRADSYGGSLANRCRLPLEVIDRVRSVVGDDMTVGIRVSADEFVPDGLEPAECVEIVHHLLERARIDFVSVSQSNYASIDRMIPDMSYPRAPFAHYARSVREVTSGVPVFAVGRLVTPEQCEPLIADGTADLVCLVRPLIADPEFPVKARDGQRAEIRECISCNVGCRGGPHRGAPIACLVNPVVGHEASWGIGKLGLAPVSRRVLVIGGGPGGLKAAETAARRGHEVTLLESSDRVGGQVLVAAAAMPYRDEFANSVRQLAAEVQRLGVDVRCGVEADVDTVLSFDPGVVVVATGSTPGRPDVPGIDSDHVASVHDAITRGVTGPRVVLVDSGEADWKCLTTAECLAAAGHQVTIVTPVPIGAEIDAFSKPPLLRRLRAAGVEWIEYHRLASVADASVEIVESLTATTRTLAADSVVLAWYGVADDGLVRRLRDAGLDQVHAVGDALAPRRAIDAVWDGFRVATAI